ncbi:hypothetical protein DY000_02012306 [Brassica cretica]|uniref:Pentacotripeptide-repeat region of PRORP domain-containing protein n=1 Tax=Brassica cretica TaxID=69181 RepID=A0ABQ7CME0_BRACR|nr:hypothetical protein DY000_02012306 [Brassica cretica]
MLARVCRSGSSSSARLFTLLDRMVETGHQPDVVTYGTIVNGLCKMGDTVSALNFLKKMEESRIKVDVVIYSSIIDRLWKDGRHSDAQNLFSERERWSDGLRLLREMLERKIDPDVVTFSVLVKEGNFFEAEELYDDMIRMGVYPNTVTYNSIIDGFCKQDRLDDAEHLFYLMSTKGCSPDVITFSTLIDGSCRAKRVDDRIKLLREMSRRGLVANAVTYNTLIHGFCQVGDLNAAQDLLHEMISSGVWPDIVMQKSKMDLDATHPFNGVEPDVQTYNILITGFINEGKFLGAEELYKEMPHRGRVGEGLKLFCEIYGRGIVANAITYKTLIHGFRQVGNINGALDIFQEMISSGVCPDTITIRNMLDGLWSKEELQKAAATLEDLEKSVALPIIAPPSSPASFFHSEPPSATQSPVGILSFSQLPCNYRPSILATGPYAHETQLVVYPV